jgi:hypothetical protein
MPEYLRKACWLALALLFLLAAWFAFKSWPDPQRGSTDHDPRLIFDTPYRNVRPEIGYVGDEVCSRCHAEAADSYHQHPMARSLAPVGLATLVEHYDPGARNPFDAGGFQYQVVQRDQRMIHQEIRRNSQGQVVVEKEEEIQFILGSGTRGRSYLVDHDGYLFQSPLSWYSQANSWDLPPGYRAQNLHFNRPVTAECLFCHANSVHAVQDTLNRFRPPIFQGYAIGCERCHGPGELHVRRRESQEGVAGLDDTIVNPRRLDPALRRAICEQCHLQGVARVERHGRQRTDYRPGLPWSLFASVFVLPPELSDKKRAVGHFEQMRASRCFLGSKQKMDCTTCHDPHHWPAAEEKEEYYRQSCLSCHQENSCSLSIGVRHMRSPNDSCIECHMTRFRSSNVAHTAITDHRISRIPPKENDGRVNHSNVPPLIYFHQDLIEHPDPELDRDLGIALIDLASKQPSKQLGKLALPLLESSLHRWPEDVLAWEAKGYALMLEGRAEETLAAFEATLARASGRERTLFGAALSAGQIGLRENSIKYWQRAIDVNPWNWEYHDELAKELAEGEDWPGAAAQCRNALRLNPAAWETRKLLVKCLLRQKEQKQARAEFDILLSFQPPDPEALRRWFAEERR